MPLVATVALQDNKQQGSFLPGAHEPTNPVFLSKIKDDRRIKPGVLRCHAGNAATCRFMQEGLQLIRDNPSDVNITNSRLEYIWQIGRFDLFDGMSLANQVRLLSMIWRATLLRLVQYLFVQQ